jgi:hypothetical protein
MQNAHRDGRLACSNRIIFPRFSPFSSPSARLTRRLRGRQLPCVARNRATAPAHSRRAAAASGLHAGPAGRDHDPPPPPRRRPPLRAAAVAGQPAVRPVASGCLASQTFSLAGQHVRRRVGLASGDLAGRELASGNDRRPRRSVRARWRTRTRIIQPSSAHPPPWRNSVGAVVVRSSRQRTSPFGGVS